MRWRAVGSGTWTNGPSFTVGSLSNVPWSQTARGLLPDAQYEYQACGEEVSWSSYACVGSDGTANTTSQFTTRSGLPNMSISTQPALVPGWSPIDQRLRNTLWQRPREHGTFRLRTASRSPSTGSPRRAAASPKPSRSPWVRSSASRRWATARHERSTCAACRATSRAGASRVPRTQPSSGRSSPRRRAFLSRSTIGSLCSTRTAFRCGGTARTCPR